MLIVTILPFGRIICGGCICLRGRWGFRGSRFERGGSVSGLGSRLGGGGRPLRFIVGCGGGGSGREG